MTDFVTRDDTNLGVGRILTSPTMYALYDNVFSLASGGLGAPRIQTAAIQNLAVTAAKLATGTAERDWVLARNAGGNTGAVGTYAFLHSSNATDVGPGGTKAGSNLRYAGVNTNSTTFNASLFGSATTAIPAGTWRAMGQDNSSSNFDGRVGATLWLRIS